MPRRREGAVCLDWETEDEESGEGWSGTRLVLEALRW